MGLRAAWTLGGLTDAACSAAETVLALLRNPQFCVYGAAQTLNERNLDRGEDTFNRISMEERGKYREETLVNYGGRSRSQPSRWVCAAAPPHCASCCAPHLFTLSPGHLARGREGRAAASPTVGPALLQTYPLCLQLLACRGRANMTVQLVGESSLCTRPGRSWLCSTA